MGQIFGIGGKCTQGLIAGTFVSLGWNTVEPAILTESGERHPIAPGESCTADGHKAVAVAVYDSTYLVRKVGDWYEVYAPTERWTLDERYLTRRGSVHNSSSGARFAWRPCHALNDAEILEAARHLGVHERRQYG